MTGSFPTNPYATNGGNTMNGMPGATAGRPGSSVPASRINHGDSKNYTRSGRIRAGATFAIGYLVVLWVVHIVNVIFFGGTLANFGIRPLDFSGIWGIFFAPLLHEGWEHLIGNSIPGALFCFIVGLSGRRAFWEVSTIVMLVAGLGTWLLGGPGTLHIGASGMVYGWLAYLIVRGIFNRSFMQTITGFILAFAYSGLIWGVLPTDAGVSWQGHLFGALGGILAGMTITSDDPVRALKR